MFPITLQDIADPTGPLRWILSGAIASWVFYSLTAHPKLSVAEQGLQGLIFIGLIQAGVLIARYVLFLIGRRAAFGTWTQDVEFFWTLGVGLLLGVALSWAAKNDFPHYWLRKLSITKRHSFPSVWYSYFNENKNSAWAIIHLRADEKSKRGPRRLYGYVDEWPDQPDSSHFILSNAEWLTGTGKSISLDRVERMLVATSDVELVEIVKPVQPGESIAVPPPKPRQKRTTVKRSKRGQGIEYEAEYPTTQTTTAATTTENEVEGIQHE